MTNLNSFAKKITEQEGLKKSVNIAQVKEVLKITLKLLKELSLKEIVVLLVRIK